MGDKNRSLWKRQIFNFFSKWATSSPEELERGSKVHLNHMDQEKPTLRELTTKNDDLSHPVRKKNKTKNFTLQSEVMLMRKENSLTAVLETVKQQPKQRSWTAQDLFGETNSGTMS